MSLGEYIGSGSGVTKLLLHLNGNSSDTSGNSNSGTDTAITYVDGKFGKCASFNGSSSQINYTKSSNNYLINDFTISAWAKLTSSTGANTIYQMGNCGLYFGGCHYWTGSADVNLSDPNIPSAPSGWHLYTWTKSSTTGNVLYRDGSPVATNANTTASSNSYGNVNVGRFDSPGNNWFDGCIDDLILESRVWTATEIKKYYTNSLGRF